MVPFSPSAGPAEERHRGRMATVWLAGASVVIVGITAAFGGLRGTPKVPLRTTGGHIVGQGLFTVTPLRAHVARTAPFGGPAKHSLIVTMRVTNVGDRSWGVGTFLNGVAAEPKPGRYVNADFMDSTAVIAGGKATEIHPRLPVDVQAAWTLPANVTPQKVTVAFRKWSYGQSFTTDVFEWTVGKDSPVAAEVTLPVEAGVRS